MADYEVKIYSSISEIPKESWDELNTGNNPFHRFDFHKALEVSDCVGDKSGWVPYYFILKNEDKFLSGLVCYLKFDSYGEFIFDWDWARAYDQYQIPYYPKLTLAIPFSPISAPKILGNLELAQQLLLPSLWDFYHKNNVSSLHSLFTQQEERSSFEELGLKERHSFQYHLDLNAITSFDAYLETLNKNRRKSIKKERRKIQENQELKIERKCGRELSPKDIEFFYQCYLTTIDKKWSQAYLNLKFFEKVLASLPTHLVIAKWEGSPIACALYIQSETTLFGRYWGSIKEVEYLHFELCIYQGIDLACELGLKSFEAGAQGEHKRLRGFTPILTYSHHHLKHPQFNKAVGDFIDQEKEGIKNLFQHFEESSPLKKITN